MTETARKKSMAKEPAADAPPELAVGEATPEQLEAGREVLELMLGAHPEPTPAALDAIEREWLGA